MSQRRIINHFLDNGNEWTAATRLTEDFGNSRSLSRLADITETRRELNNTLYRLRPEVYDEIIEERKSL